MKRIKIFFLRVAAFLFLWLRIYANWSRLHRLLFDRVARQTPLPTFRDFEEILPYLRGMVWRPDSWLDLGDAICSPEMVWWRYLNAADHKVGDCDEFAIFLCNVIANSISSGTWELPNLQPAFMTVMWMDSLGISGGHNVCYLQQLVPYTAVPGVWRIRHGYMDYDRPQWFDTLEAVPAAVRARYAGADAVALGWAISEKDLSIREVHWGE